MTDASRPGGYLLLGCLAGALSYWLWFGLTQYTVTTDPGISILAAQSILEHGYPLLPSGALYHRAFLPNYMVAGSMALFGVNDFAIMFPSLLLALGSLYIAYLLGRDVLKRRWLGLAAVLLLIALQIQTSAATSPRMYMALQFFTSLAVYGAWRGYVEGSRGLRVVALLAVVGAALSHQQGGILILALPAAIALSRWLKGDFPLARRALRPLSGFAVLLVLYLWLVVWYRPSNAVERIALRGGVGAGLSGLNLDPVRWMSQINWLEQAIPFSVLLGPIMAFATIRVLLRRGTKDDTAVGIVFLVAVLVAWIVGVLGYIQVSGTRFWIGIAPICVLVMLASARVFAVWLLGTEGSVIGAGDRARVGAAVGFVAWVAFAIAGYSSYYGLGGYPEVIRSGFGIPCLDGGGCSKEMKSEYLAVRSLLADDDVIVASNPFVARYYLGRVDGWLVQRRTGDAHAAFSSPVDEYLGVQLIDAPEKVMGLREGERRAWIVTDKPRDRDLDPEFQALLAELFDEHPTAGLLTVYTNDPALAAEAGTARGTTNGGRDP